MLDLLFDLTLKLHQISNNCSNESVTSFGNHQRKIFSITKLFWVLIWGIFIPLYLHLSLWTVLQCISQSCYLYHDLVINNCWRNKSVGIIKFSWLVLSSTKTFTWIYVLYCVLCSLRLSIFYTKLRKRAENTQDIWILPRLNQKKFIKLFSTRFYLLVYRIFKRINNILYSSKF